MSFFLRTTEYHVIKNNKLLYRTRPQRQPGKRFKNSLNVYSRLQVEDMGGKPLLLIEISGGVQFRKTVRLSINTERAGQISSMQLEKSKSLIEHSTQLTCVEYGSECLSNAGLVSYTTSNILDI